MEGLPEIITKIPEAPLLQSYISYYYFLKEENLPNQVEFWHYPHYYSTLNIFRKGHIHWDKATQYILPDTKQGYACLYSQNIHAAQKVVLTQSYDVVGVVFKPLGANRFLSPFLDPRVFNYRLENFERSFGSSLDELFANKHYDRKVQVLDELFTGLYQAFEQPLLSKAIAHTLAARGDVSLRELSDSLEVSRRTLLRHFQQYLGYSFRDFKAVVKFREALKTGIQQEKKKSLSQLAYSCNYYDQSDFIKQFKLKSLETPKHMFKALTQVSEQLLWKVS